MKKNIKFASINEEQRLVYGVVLEPNVQDLQGDTATVDEIRKAAHGFLKSPVIGESHKKQADAELCESYLAPTDMKLGEADISAGSWIIAVKCSPELFKQVKAGDFEGFSIGAEVTRIPL